MARPQIKTYFNILTRLTVYNNLFSHPRQYRVRNLHRTSVVSTVGQLCAVDVEIMGVSGPPVPRPGLETPPWALITPRAIQTQEFLDRALPPAQPVDEIGWEIDPTLE